MVAAVLLGGGGMLAIWRAVAMIKTIMGRGRQVATHRIAARRLVIFMRIAPTIIVTGIGNRLENCSGDKKENRQGD